MSTELTLLVVEDDDIDYETIERAVGKQNLSWDLFRATTGLEGLKLLEEKYPLAKTPVLILLDLNMPGMNGIEFLKALRADERHKHLPVIVTTTSDHYKDREETQNHGIQGYFLKNELDDHCKALFECIQKEALA